MPTGTLMKKIQLQSKCSVSRPPTSGPIARALAETPTQMPIAIPRCRGGNVAVMIERVAGFISAEPTPWTIRAPMRDSAPVARPQAREAAVKITRPTMKMRRRPNMSASFPPLSMTTANVSAYPVTTHWSSEVEIWRSSWIEESATKTTVLSSMIMKRPKATAPSVHHLRFSSAKIRARTIGPFGLVSAH